MRPWPARSPDARREAPRGRRAAGVTACPPRPHRRDRGRSPRHRRLREDPHAPGRRPRGVALGTLYRYFPSKERLFATALIRWAQTFQQSYERTIRSSETEPAERVRRTMHVALKAFERNPCFFGLLMALQVSDDPEVAARLRALHGHHQPRRALRPRRDRRAVGRAHRDPRVGRGVQPAAPLVARPHADERGAQPARRSSASTSSSHPRPPAPASRATATWAPTPAPRSAPSPRWCRRAPSTPRWAARLHRRAARRRHAPSPTGAKYHVIDHVDHVLRRTSR